MAKTLINRVASSGLITIDLEQFYPELEIVTFDLKDFLFMEMILKELDFRKALKEIDWSIYHGKVVTLLCSNDAIIPMWAYMLVVTYLEGVAATITEGTKEDYLSSYYNHLLDNMDMSPYQDKMIVIKGCGDKGVPIQAYVTLTARLQSVAKSIMYGEPCSTVPIYKKPKK